MEFSKHNWATYDLRDNLPRDAHFCQVGLLDTVLSEYPEKSHNFKNFIFMMSHFSTLLKISVKAHLTSSVSRIYLYT